MTTAGAGVTPAFKIDDSRWIHERIRVGDNEAASPSFEDGIYLHTITCPPPADKQPKGTILLIHGFPQTAYQFRRVITPLSNAGYHVIAPDYRGAGSSSKPWNGYTKKVMAQDLHSLVQQLGIKDKVHLVGHDIGGMIAHSYAAQFPDEVASIAQGENPLPGSKGYHESKNTLQVWHFTFHAIPDLPEALIQGRERIYLKHFFDRLAQNPDAISSHDLDVYATAYAQPGAMRAGLNVYRCFEQDGEDHVKSAKENGKSKVRSLALWGGSSFANEEMATSMASEFYEDVQFEAIPDAGHWISEEKPKEFVDVLLKWFEES
ncbi:Putative alpha/beta hydrolase-1, epoxide hydrolase [Septoria linicola]|uniref:Alpha/beta hydrolase-1, epoxide hydrolase n=1 Tax=Septoria linicola TaxID=215465 RepID=A0A9Q9EFD6_9PEZI|nr:putative alpha/beta hydrolase-1, epoxide hydrolase [Septoria linicola]USW48840.1 Putative alpha/beta hydrolase-1, epoxide hydrolase [Septoria linicola]